MGLSISFFHGLGLELRHVDGPTLDEIFLMKDAGEFGWGFHISLLCFDIVVGFRK